MAGRLGHIAGDRRVGHVPVNGLRVTNYAYGFGGLEFWLDASEGTNTKTDGANISSWIDKIKNVEFSQSTGTNQPLYRAADTNFNNLPSIDFNTNVKLLSSINGFGTSNSFTIFFVIKVNTIQIALGGNYFLTNGTVSSAQGPAILLGGAGPNVTGIGWYNGNDPNPTKIFNSTVESTTSHICVLTNSNITIDGVNDGSGTLTGRQNYNVIGLNVANSGRNVFSRIAEIGYINNELSASDSIILCDRLNSKYAIY
jgi:hypothetical protein